MRGFSSAGLAALALAATAIAAEPQQFRGPFLGPSLGHMGIDNQQSVTGPSHFAYRRNGQCLGQYHVR
jgi:hypothetical protein